jgi:hypothetical protein
MTPTLNFFATPGPITALNGQAGAFQGLPADIDRLRRIVQGLVIHVFWAGHYQVRLDETRQAELQLRHVPRQLARLLELDPRPLTEARPPERRLVGNCRDFSTLLTAMLRARGLPARARCGFGRYFEPGRHIDHWVCEYWHAGQGRWLLADAQLDNVQCQALGIRFDPLDVPRDQFIVGGLAWQLCRQGRADPDTFGIHDMHGLWFVRGDLVRDVAALNKVELLPWDGWGLCDARDDELKEGDLALLDRLAELTAGDVPDFKTVADLYCGEPRLTVPPVIRSYTQAGPVEVRLAAG